MDTKDTRREKLRELIHNKFNGSQKALSDRSGISLSQISQYLSLTLNKTMGEKIARKIERAAGVHAGYLDGIPPPIDHIDDKKPQIIALSKEDKTPEGFVRIPVSSVKFSAGNGYIADYELEEAGDTVTYSLDWFRATGIKPDRCKRFKVKGDSMEKMLFDGDSVLVNLDETNIVDGYVYALRYGDDLRVKRLKRRIDGTITLESENSQYKTEEISPTVAEEHITIIGRVREKSGRGGL